MTDRTEIRDGVRELSVGDEEGGDLAVMQHIQKLVDLRVHDRLSDKREGTVPDLKSFFQSLG